MELSVNNVFYIFPDSPILFLLSLYARNRIVRNVTVSAARREIQIPFNPNNFASITAQITIATIPLRNDPTIAIFGSSTHETGDRSSGNLYLCWIMEQLLRTGIGYPVQEQDDGSDPDCNITRC